MLRILFDIEANELLRKVTKKWCLVTKDIDTNQIKVFIDHEDLVELLATCTEEQTQLLMPLLELNMTWQEYLHSADMLIGHGIINYDLNVLKKLHGFIRNPKTILQDTVLFSQLLNFRRFGFRGHSLELWGEALGDHKIYFKDWSKLTFDMVVYCIQDVNLNHKVYKQVVQEFVTQRGRNPRISLSLRNEHSAALFMAESELQGWLFDKAKGLLLLKEMEFELKTTEDVIEPTMGFKLIVKDQVNLGTYEGDEKNLLSDGTLKPYSMYFANDTFYAVPVKFPKWLKNGTYTTSIAQWFGVTQESGLYVDCLVEGPFTRISFVPRSLSSPIDAKVWLHSIGWEADDWNFKKDPVTFKFVKTSEKVSESSLQRLGTIGQLYDRYLTTSSRANILRGWLNELDENDRLHGGAMVFGTPTGRMTHKVIANIPTVDNLWGKEIRSLFIADPGTVVIGCDSEGNQARGLCFYLKNEEYTKLIMYGDVHTSNGNQLIAISQEIGEPLMTAIPPRAIAKKFFYAILFGAGGDKCALIVFGKRSDKGKILKQKFIEAVPGFAELSGKLEHDFKKYKGKLGLSKIIGLDGGLIYTDSAHKSLNYLLQRFESITVKSAIHYMVKKFEAEGIWYKPLIIYHDETQFLVKDDPEIIKRAKEIAEEAFTEAAKEFGVMITNGKAKHGNNWADTH